MTDDGRRCFLKSTVLAASLLPVAQARSVAEAHVRAEWLALLTRVADPVISNLAAHQLKARMPVECPTGNLAERKSVTHLEALGRTLCGLAPWLEASGLSEPEEKTRARFADLSRRALTNAVDPSSADKLDFTAGKQNLVDAAFLASALARARRNLWEALDVSVRQRIIAALQSTRVFVPYESNWLLFASIIEAFLASVGAEWQAAPIEKAISSHESWYKGDGTYGDGPSFHWDYYNSYVIQPFLIETLELVEPASRKWAGFHDKVLERARRYAVIQERLIAVDGSFPVIGRSIAYRCGAFHHLAFMALRRGLPPELTPAQVRGALTAVIHRTLSAKGTFDSNGWLRVGLVGAQPSLAEGYISTGSLYLCTLAFLPLGLSPTDPFWSAPHEDWTAKKIWSGKDGRADHAI
jgi:hypothetical protein